MNSSQEIVLQLLRVALGQSRDCEIPAEVGFDRLTTSNWEEVMDFAAEQGVFEVCFDGVEKTLSSSTLKGESMGLSMDNLMEWYGQVSYQEIDFAHHWEVACELDKLWASKGISATILKGRSVAQYYPKPNHRFSCDLDVFIPSGDWEKAIKVLEEKGVELVFEVYKEAEFTYDGVYVECHRYITPLRGLRNLVAVERYLRSLLEYERYYFEGTSLIRPPLMFNAILFVEHALGDLQQGTLSLKHVMDWMVLRRQEVHWDSFVGHVREFGFERFYRLIDAMADVVEGIQKYEALTVSYRSVFDDIFAPKTGVKSGQSWFRKRVGVFFVTLKNYRYFRDFSYCSMWSYLFNTMWTHFFRKGVEL